MVGIEFDLSGRSSFGTTAGVDQAGSLEACPSDTCPVGVDTLMPSPAAVYTAFTLHSSCLLDRIPYCKNPVGRGHGGKGSGADSLQAERSKPES